uniref:Uncharacterized protein n=1 Tax=CrAss-like virus sp. ctUXy6 TaxID=2825835 RepID=A0A8S5V7I9_9CAUD|nr:MAG TPA: hypothetical protein [CrAss-like virus sp. ctUXy6]
MTGKRVASTGTSQHSFTSADKQKREPPRITSAATPAPQTLTTTIYQILQAIYCSLYSTILN